MRTKKQLNLTLHPKLIEALDQYCQENHVLKNEIIALLLLHFFSNNESVSRSVQTILDGFCLEDFLKSPKSNIDSEFESNEALMKLVNETKIFSWHYKTFGDDMSLNDFFGQ